MTAPKEMKEEFPILKRNVHGKQLIYLDSSATTQKPQQVLDALRHFYTTSNANVHRVVHTLGEEATALYEQTRKKVADFVRASTEEIVFTRGTTDSINMLACMLESSVQPDDEVMISAMEHHSNLIPWQQLCKRRNAKLVVVGMNQEYEIDPADLKAKLSEKTKIVSFVHVSHVLGVINPVRELIKIIRNKNKEARIVVDGAQAVAHLAVDVKSIDCDFYVFSAHKMYGPTGVGVLYGKKALLDKLEPASFGGGMITSVSFEKSTWLDSPHKFEPGTPNIADVIAFGTAIDFMQRDDVKKAQEQEKDLIKLAHAELSKLSSVTILGPKDCSKRSGLIAFTVKDLHPHDVATGLDQYGVAVRAGHHCAMPLHKKLGIDASTRMSFGVYNTKEDVKTALEALKKTIAALKK
ncbi:TPA: SufS family cysteine desulfurase [Candidatus Woesearchaeota archaeon]|nr:SufS family cysteine desulfurase [Candidatus Woesearchaeota archaeon]